MPMSQGITLDPWQKSVLETSGNICLRSGRQVGKSTVIGRKAAEYALNNPGKLIMIISRTERQAGLLFSKILVNIHQIDKRQLMRGKERPTKHLIHLKNKSKIYSLPAGDTGYGIMGFTIDLLIADEAAFIPEEVWNSIIPALAITRGEIWLLSTPFVKQGYYFQCFSDPSFTAFHTSSEDCPRKDQAFLDRQKEILTKAQYAQMYLGQFVDEIRQFFPDLLIRRCCVGKRRPEINPGTYYIGCDVARMDRDEFTFEILEKRRGMMIHVHNEMTKNIPLTESTREIIRLNEEYDFKKEYIDSGGMGIAVCDLLREDEENKRKIVEINNASRVYGRDTRGKDIKELRRRIVKEELYNNLKNLMENGKIILLDDDEVKASLKCIQAEHDQNSGKLKIWGDYSHITEGIIRAAWGSQDRTLEPFIQYF